jgi:hypothetical protein
MTSICSFSLRVLGFVFLSLNFSFGFVFVRDPREADQHSLPPLRKDEQSSATPSPNLS